MEQKLELTIELLQKQTQDIYTWFESLTIEEVVAVCKKFMEQVNNNPDYTFVAFTKNVLMELSKTKTDEEMFVFVQSDNNALIKQIQSHPLYKNTELAFAYFYKGIIAFYNQYPKDENIKTIAKDFFSLQYSSGIMEKSHWSDTDIFDGAEFS